MSRIEEASSYLEAVSVWIQKSTLAELPLRLREIARNLESLAHGAEIELSKPKEPDDY